MAKIVAKDFDFDVVEEVATPTVQSTSTVSMAEAVAGMAALEKEMAAVLPKVKVTNKATGLYI